MPSEDFKSTDSIKEYLIHRKDNKYPRLVLSIIGDSSTFVPKPWLTPVFQLGLIETAKGANSKFIMHVPIAVRLILLVFYS